MPDTDASTDTPTSATDAAAKAEGDGTDWKAEADKWQALARKHEDRAKTNSQAAKELEEFRRQSMTDQERAIEAARSEAKQEAVAAFAGRVAEAELRAAAAGRLTDDQVSTLLDGVNLTRRGGDYGWPIVEGRGGDSRFVDPQVVWRTDEASPSGLAIVDDVAFVGALKGRRLWQVPLAGGRAGTPVAAFRGTYGRLRTVVAAPDGTLWVTTSNRDGRGDPTADDDRVLRVTLR